MTASSHIARFVAFFAATIILSSLAFAGAPWIGTWKLNLAKSKFSPGPGPRSQTVTFGLSEEGIKVTIDSIDADGKATHSEYTSKFDGKEVPWKGNPNADTASPRVIDAHSYENPSKKGGKATITSRVVVSRDDNTLTAIQTGKDSEGRTVNHTAVYDRQ